MYKKLIDLYKMF